MRTLSVCGMILACFLDATAKGTPKKISGSGPDSQSIEFTIDQPYCGTRASAYTYDSSKSDVITEGITRSARSLTVTDPLPSPPGKFEDPGTTIIDASNKTLQSDGSDAQRLIVRAFAAGTCKPLALTGDKDRSQSKDVLQAEYYVINVVVWDKASSKSNQPTYKTSSNDWFLFNARDAKPSHQVLLRRFSPELSADTRIFGSKSIVFLAIHLRGTTMTSGDKEEKKAAEENQAFQRELERFEIKYTIDVKKKVPINVQDLLALIKVVTGVGAEAVPPIPIGRYGGGLLKSLKDIPSDITFSAKVKLPDSSSSKDANDAHTTQPTGGNGAISNGAARVARSGDPASRASETNAGGQTDQQASKPAQKDDNQSAQKGGEDGQDQSSVTFSKTYDDEGLYHWDVSVGVPVNALNQLEYSSTDGKVTAKTVSRENAYGLFDIYPVATDLKAPPAFSYPHLVLGLPFSGKVFNKPFFGMGGVIGFKSLPGVEKFLSTTFPIQFNFYGGVVYNKEFRPGTLPPGSPASGAALANDLHPYRVWKGQFGIEFSIRDVADKLAPKDKSKDTTKDTSKK